MPVVRRLIESGVTNLVRKILLLYIMIGIIVSILIANRDTYEAYMNKKMSCAWDNQGRDFLSIKKI